MCLIPNLIYWQASKYNTALIWKTSKYNNQPPCNLWLQQLLVSYNIWHDRQANTTINHHTIFELMEYSVLQLQPLTWKTSKYNNQPPYNLWIDGIGIQQLLMLSCDISHDRQANKRTYHHTTYKLMRYSVPQPLIWKTSKYNSQITIQPLTWWNATSTSILRHDRQVNTTINHHTTFELALEPWPSTIKIAWCSSRRMSIAALPSPH